MNKLQKFWVHSDCSVRYKLIVCDAIVRSKLIYGLETAHLRKPERESLDKFQRRGLRRIIGWKATLIQRKNTNEIVREQYIAGQNTCMNDCMQ